jgi:hypothetical protein
MRRWLERRYDIYPEGKPTPLDRVGVGELLDTQVGRTVKEVPETPPPSEPPTPPPQVPATSTEVLRTLPEINPTLKESKGVLGWLTDNVIVPVTDWVSKTVSGIFTGTPLPEEGVQVTPPTEEVKEAQKVEAPNPLDTWGWRPSESQRLDEAKTTPADILGVGGGGLRFFLETAASQWEQWWNKHGKPKPTQSPSGQIVPYIGIVHNTLEAGWDAFTTLANQSPKLFEYILAEAIYGGDRQKWGVDTPEKERAFSASLGIAYSGPIRRRALYDAILAEGPNVSAARIQQLQDIFADPTKQFIGSFLDPLNIIDVGAITTRFGIKAREINRVADVLAPVLREGAEKARFATRLGDVLDKIAPTEEIVRNLESLSTVSGQLKNATGPVDRLVTLIFPRTKDTMVYKVTSEATQMAEAINGIVRARIRARMLTDPELIAVGIREGTEKFEEVLRQRFARAMGFVGENLVKAASDDINEVRAALKVLDDLGLGGLAASRPGRNLSVILRRMVTDDEGKIGDLSKALGLAKASRVEDVVDAWARKMHRVVDDLIPTPSWQRVGTPLKTAQGIIKRRAKLDEIFARLYMGMNIGYAMRNMASNLATIVLEGYSPFAPFNSMAELERRLGFRVAAAHQGIGAAEAQTPLRPGITTIGLWLGQQGERVASEIITSQATQRAINQLWKDAVVGIQASMPDTLAKVFRDDPQAMRWLEGRLQRVVDMGSGWTAYLRDEIADFLKRRGVQVNKKNIEITWEPWRQLPAELEGAMHDLGMQDLAFSLEIAAMTSPTPVDYINKIGEIRTQLLKHLEHIADKAPEHVGAPTSSAAMEAMDAVQTAVDHVLENVPGLDGEPIAKAMREISEYVAQKNAIIDNIYARAIAKASTASRRDIAKTKDIMTKLFHDHNEAMNAARSAQQKLLAEYMLRTPHDEAEAAEMLHSYLEEIRKIYDDVVEHTRNAFESRLLMESSGTSGITMPLDFLEKASDEWFLDYGISVEAHDAELMEHWVMIGNTTLSVPALGQFHQYVQKTMGKAYGQLGLEEKLALFNELYQANHPGAARFIDAASVRRHYVELVRYAHAPKKPVGVAPASWRVNVSVPEYKLLTPEQFNNRMPTDAPAPQASYGKGVPAVSWPGLSDMNMGRVETVTFYRQMPNGEVLIWDRPYAQETPAELADLLARHHAETGEWPYAIIKTRGGNLVVVSAPAATRPTRMNAVLKTLSEIPESPSTGVEWYTRMGHSSSQYVGKASTLGDLLEGKSPAFDVAPMVGAPKDALEHALDTVYQDRYVEYWLDSFDDHHLMETFREAVQKGTRVPFAVAVDWGGNHGLYILKDPFLLWNSEFESVMDTIATDTFGGTYILKGEFRRGMLVIDGISKDIDRRRISQGVHKSLWLLREYLRRVFGDAANRIIVSPLNVPLGKLLKHPPGTLYRTMSSALEKFLYETKGFSPSMGSVDFIDAVRAIGTPNLEWVTRRRARLIMQDAEAGIHIWASDVIQDNSGNLQLARPWLHEGDIAPRVRGEVIVTPQGLFVRSAWETRLEVLRVLRDELPASMDVPVVWVGHTPHGIPSFYYGMLGEMVSGERAFVSSLTQLDFNKSFAGVLVRGAGDATYQFGGVSHIFAGDWINSETSLRFVRGRADAVVFYDNVSKTLTIPLDEGGLSANPETLQEVLRYLRDMGAPRDATLKLVSKDRSRMTLTDFETVLRGDPPTEVFVHNLPYLYAFRPSKYGNTIMAYSMVDPADQAIVKVLSLSSTHSDEMFIRNAVVDAITSGEPFDRLRVVVVDPPYLKPEGTVREIPVYSEFPWLSQVKRVRSYVQNVGTTDADELFKDGVKRHWFIVGGDVRPTGVIGGTAHMLAIPEDVSGEVIQAILGTYERWGSPSVGVVSVTPNAIENVITIPYWSPEVKTFVRWVFGDPWKIVSQRVVKKPTLASQIPFRLPDGAFAFVGDASRMVGSLVAEAPPTSVSEMVGAAAVQVLGNALDQLCILGNRVIHPNLVTIMRASHDSPIEIVGRRKDIIRVLDFLNSQYPEESLRVPVTVAFTDGYFTASADVTQDVVSRPVAEWRKILRKRQAMGKVTSHILPSVAIGSREELFDFVANNPDILEGAYDLRICREVETGDLHYVSGEVPEGYAEVIRGAILKHDGRVHVVWNPVDIPHDNLVYTLWDTSRKFPEIRGDSLRWGNGWEVSVGMFIDKSLLADYMEHGGQVLSLRDYLNVLNDDAREYLRWIQEGDIGHFNSLRMLPVGEGWLSRPWVAYIRKTPDRASGKYIDVVADQSVLSADYPPRVMHYLNALMPKHIPVDDLRAIVYFNPDIGTVVGVFGKPLTRSEMIHYGIERPPAYVTRGLSARETLDSLTIVNMTDGAIVTGARAFSATSDTFELPKDTARLLKAMTFEDVPVNQRIGITVREGIIKGVGYTGLPDSFEELRRVGGVSHSNVVRMAGQAPAVESIAYALDAPVEDCIILERVSPHTWVMIQTGYPVDEAPKVLQQAGLLNDSLAIYLPDGRNVSETEAKELLDYVTRLEKRLANVDPDNPEIRHILDGSFPAAWRRRTLENLEVSPFHKEVFMRFLDRLFPDDDVRVAAKAVTEAMARAWADVYGKSPEVWYSLVQPRIAMSKGGYAGLYWTEVAKDGVVRSNVLINTIWAGDPYSRLDTLVHELLHFAGDWLPYEDILLLSRHFGVSPQAWGVPEIERFAELGVYYLRKKYHPPEELRGVFERFAELVRAFIYHLTAFITQRRNPLPPAIMSIYDRILGAAADNAEVLFNRTEYVKALRKLVQEIRQGRYLRDPHQIIENHEAIVKSAWDTLREARHSQRANAGVLSHRMLKAYRPYVDEGPTSPIVQAAQRLVEEPSLGALRAESVTLPEDVARELPRPGDTTPVPASPLTFFEDQQGRVHYVITPDRPEWRGKQISMQDYLDYLAEAERRVGNNSQALTILQAARESLNAPAPLPGPSALQQTESYVRNAVNFLDAAAEHARKALAEGAPPTAYEVAGLLGGVDDELDDWIRLIESRQAETYTAAAWYGKFVRNRALLDYPDRRTIDFYLQLIFPWHYWYTRTIPRWVAGLVTSPGMLGTYAKLTSMLSRVNAQDENVPEWALNTLKVKVPGFDGNVYWNFSSTFFPLSAVADTFEDEDRQRDVLGRVLSTVGMFGPAPHPLLWIAYAAERYFLQKDRDALITLGYLAPATRTFASLTGITLEPWLWLRDPITGEAIPGKGGTKWNVAKATRYLAEMQRQGVISKDEALYAATTRAGPTFEQSLWEVLKIQRIPAIASVALGLRLTPRGTWEDELARYSREYNELKEAMGSDKAADKVLGEAPWVSVAWMSYDNHLKRLSTLTWDVLHRVPPGEVGNRILESAGMNSIMRDAFYESRGDLSGWAPQDVRALEMAVLGLAKVLKSPEDKQKIAEWEAAREARQRLYERAGELFPGFESKQARYFQLLETRGENVANAYAMQEGLYKFWDWQRGEIVRNPLLLRYYADPEDVDKAAVAIVETAAEARWQGIHKVNEQYWSIRSRDSREAREFLRANPQLTSYWNWRKIALNNVKDKLNELRKKAGQGKEDVSVYQLTSPTLQQRAVLEAIPRR